MSGNPLINDATDAAGVVDYAWNHALTSDEVHKLIHGLCRFGDKLTPDELGQCNKSFTGFTLTAFAEINIFSIYTPICLSLSSSKEHTRVMSHNLVTSQNIWDRLPYGYDPCTRQYAEKYFNRKDVQTTLHANVTNIPYPYTVCSSVIKWTEAPQSVIPIIQKLLKGGLRIWSYSGDTDGRLPVTSTRYSLTKMRLKVESPWRSWFHKSQVAGWVETYAGGLTFVTVRGAGHLVPLFAPAQSLTLYSHFLSSLPLPPSRF